MVNFYVTYKFENKEQRDGFIKAIKEARIAEITRDEEGCVRYDYFYPLDSDREIFLWEQWDSKEAQQAHTGQPHFATIGKIKEKYKAACEFDSDK